jgi:hypothetical protein
MAEEYCCEECGSTENLKAYPGSNASMKQGNNNSSGGGLISNE